MSGWLQALTFLYLVVSTGALVALVMHVREVSENLRSRDIDHAMCIAHVSHYVGNHFAADVLKAAATDYSRPSTQIELHVIAREQWVEHGPLIPAIWMTNRADALRTEVTS